MAQYSFSPWGRCRNLSWTKRGGATTVCGIVPQPAEQRGDRSHHYPENCPKTSHRGSRSHQYSRHYTITYRDIWQGVVGLGQCTRRQDASQNTVGIRYLSVKVHVVFRMNTDDGLIPNKVKTWPKTTLILLLCWCDHHPQGHDCRRNKVNSLAIFANFLTSSLNEWRHGFVQTPTLSRQQTSKTILHLILNFLDIWWKWSDTQPVGQGHLDNTTLALSLTYWYCVIQAG